MSNNISNVCQLKQIGLYRCELSPAYVNNGEKVVDS